MLTGLTMFEKFFQYFSCRNKILKPVEMNRRKSKIHFCPFTVNQVTQMPKTEFHLKCVVCCTFINTSPGTKQTGLKRKLFNETRQYNIQILDKIK